VGYIYITKFINMKKSFLSVLISLVILPSFINAQEVEKQKLATLYSRIPIVKYVDLGLTKTGIDYLVSRGVNENQDLIVLKEFIKVNFGWDLIVTEEQRKERLFK
jgi:predicted ABC-type exoprotein transport system permease subunit